MKTLLVQPGPYGDILVCAPIAKWYTDRGYDVTWPIAERFYNLVSQLGYVVPFRIRSEGSLDSDWLKSDVMKLFPYFNSYTSYKFYLYLSYVLISVFCQHSSQIFLGEKNAYYFIHLKFLIKNI